ncbi:MAG: hypothetical protein WAT20_08370 [Ferruginibacter sp.]|nr:hypothetical protein [Chitinophagaceae bacterium]
MSLIRKIAAFILLSVYLFTATAITELFKLPVLISHYYGHREENKSMNLSSFLIQHYYYEDGTDKDVEEDNKLPFKSPENAGSVTFISLSPPNVQYCITDTNEGIKKIFGMYTPPFLPSQYLNTIWQPPRYGYAVSV